MSNLPPVDFTGSRDQTTISRFLAPLRPVYTVDDGDHAGRSDEGLSSQQETLRAAARPSGGAPAPVAGQNRYWSWQPPVLTEAALRAMDTILHRYVFWASAILGGLRMHTCKRHPPSGTHPTPRRGFECGSPDGWPRLSVAHAVVDA